MLDLKKLLSAITLRNPDLVEHLLRKRAFDPKTGCVLAGKHLDRYYYISYLGHRMKAHRALYRASFGPIPDGLGVCHTCDTPACIAPWHLFAGTNADNMKDMWSKDRGHRVLVANQGEGNGFSKLTNETVRDIRARAAAGELRAKIAKDHGVTTRQVWSVVTRRSWKHVA